MAAGIGGFVALPVMHLLIELVGWQQSLVWLMVITALLIPLAWPIGGKPVRREGPVRDQTLMEALREAFQHPSFWLLTAGFFVCGFHVAFIMVHLPAFTVDQGLPSWVGPYALSVVGIANIVGTFIAGQSGRFIEKRRGLSLIYFGRAILFLGFLYLPITPVSVIVICGLLGLLVALHHPADERPGRHLLRHDLDVDAVRHRVPLAPARLVPRRVARRTALRHDQILRRHVVDLDRAGSAGRADKLADPGEAGGEAGSSQRAPGRRIDGNDHRGYELGAAS